jgi:O-antigen/teichoic acid export membrane protein
MEGEPMSSAAAAVEPKAAPAAGRRLAFDGAALASAAMLGSGILAYAFLVLGAQTLGKAAYGGQLAVFWAGLFLAVVVLFRPLEQTLSRTLSDRLARGEEVRTALRAVGAIYLTLATGVVLVGIVAHEPLADRLFRGDGAMVVFLVAGIVGYGFAYLMRGIAGGIGWFAGFGLLLLTDGIVLFGTAVPLAIFAPHLLALSVVAAGVCGALVPLVRGWSRIRPLFAAGSGARFRRRSALAFAGPASVIAGADTILVNGGALLVVLAAGSSASAEAGVVFAATMLVRVPGFLVHGLAASLLSNLTHLQAVAQSRAFRRAVAQAAGGLVAAGAVLLAGAVALGPELMRVVYGAGFDAGRMELSLLAGGVGAYLASGTYSQALLALDRGRAAAVAWGGSAFLFIALYALLPGSHLGRIGAAFLAASFAGLVLLAAAFHLKRAKA